MTPGLSTAASFEFFSVAYLTQIGNLSAGTISELLAGLERCTDACIFHHTYQTLGTHHFLTEGFSNDFAHWVLAYTNRDELAERLAALDIRDYPSLALLRSDLCMVVRDYCKQHPEFAEQSALERLHFCETVEITLPLGLKARTLQEFRDGVSHLSHSGFFFHFIASRLRLHWKTNDFSNWLSNSLGLTRLAEAMNRIDVYTNTLDSARGEVLRLIDQERGSHNGGTGRKPPPAR